MFQPLPALCEVLALADIRVRKYLAGTGLGLSVPIFRYWYIL
ncbi:MAG: hypothetical protein OEY80_12205 [Nitrospirota bacterium]|nr:hypothetical protein [Nitrospirota bacterium]